MKREGGQAAVEAALTLPMTLFMVLGALQLFLLLQGRILAQYAVGRATRMGSLHHAKCLPMVQSAIAVLLPAIDPSFAVAGRPGRAYAREVKARSTNNQYQPGKDGGRTGPVVWIDRVRPLAATIDPATEEDEWNLPEGPDRTLEVRMTFWFPLKIPFANWAFARLSMAHWGVEEYRQASPYILVAKDARWVQSPTGAAPLSTVTNEMRSRFHASPPQYVFPIQASAAMRMMSPARFSVQKCQ